MTAPSPIPVIPGDDWSWMFGYADSSGDAIDLTDCTVEGLLYVPYQAQPIRLSADQGRALVVTPASGVLALGLEAGTTQSVRPDDRPASPVSRLRIELVGQGGLVRTIATWPLVILDPRTLYGDPLAVRMVTDPVTGAVLTLLGPASGIPVPPEVGSIDFSNFLNSGLIARL